MTAISQVYKCAICGNIVEVVHAGKGALACCGQPMELLTEKTEKDEYREKHAPVAAATDSGLKVTVGSVLHPMDEKHYIEWIELLADGNVQRRFLQPGEAPEAHFPAQAAGTVRAYCNLHGLWKTTL